MIAYLEKATALIDDSQEPDVHEEVEQIHDANDDCTARLCKCSLWLNRLENLTVTNELPPPPVVAGFATTASTTAPMERSTKWMHCNVRYCRYKGDSEHGRFGGILPYSQHQVTHEIHYGRHQPSWSLALHSLDHQCADYNGDETIGCI